MQRIIERQYEYNLIQLLYLYFDLCASCIEVLFMILSNLNHVFCL